MRAVISAGVIEYREFSIGGLEDRRKIEMANTTDLERVDEYMKLQQFAGKISDKTFDSWKSLVAEMKKGFEIKNPTCCDCGEKPGTHHYCHECYGNIQEILNIVC